MENLRNDNVAGETAERPVIKVTLYKNSKGNEVLHFDGADEDLDIDFTKSDQSSLRRLFCWLLDELFKRRADLELEKDPSVKNQTYQKIAEDYIQDLNAEINSFFISESDAIKELASAIDVDSSKGNEIEQA